MKSREIIRDLLGVILGDPKAKLPGYLPRVIDGVPHVKDCRIGEAVDGYTAPDYAPCSDRCLEARERSARALTFLWAPALPNLKTRPSASPARGRARRVGDLPSPVRRREPTDLATAPASGRSRAARRAAS